MSERIASLKRQSPEDSKANGEYTLNVLQEMGFQDSGSFPLTATHY